MRRRIRVCRCAMGSRVDQTVAVVHVVCARRERFAMRRSVFRFMCARRIALESRAVRMVAAVHVGFAVRARFVAWIISVMRGMWHACRGATGVNAVRMVAMACAAIAKGERFAEAVLRANACRGATGGNAGQTVAGECAEIVQKIQNVTRLLDYVWRIA